MVAESIVTFGPIDQRGWLSACSTVTWSRSRSGCAQNGPPLAVMIRRRTLFRCSPHKHCQMALCSESTGRMPRAPAAFITSAPAMTSTSLVASATSFPASSAAIVGASARAPGMATTTRSQRGSVTMACTLASKSGSPAWPWISYSALRLADRVPSVRPNSRSRPGLRSMTSRVCWPIEPVAPRMATLMARVISMDQMRRILDLGDSLHLRLDEIAHQRADSDERADEDSVDGRDANNQRHADEHHDHRSQDAGDRALDRLVRADRGEERMTADAAAHQKSSGVVGDDRQDREERPHETIWLRGVEQQVVVERHADVERPGEPHRPPAEALPAAGYDKKCRQAPHQREREDQVDVDLLQHGAAERKEGAQRKQEPGGGS